ncbi:acyltransferase [Mucilaginibacter sp. L3T2-6]|uniref:acyltransferase n=1 Tax=Mucilaginibacter sp. L3T2-6 TaxID=3062491 RepID=UPI002675ED74|nr:acyltransferase family protein [Mucilaginibacter sp. L3T2-6]MDO3645155.1 acyltransferase family protein [Mucilaginibacter sp. L3T2-6]MDV6217645.1 acyltransferase family protein [Mucilaginibacter sp. L3T2-6]
MPPAKPHNIDWISNIRLVALYAVIILHVTSQPLMQYGKVPMSDWWVADFFNAIVRFAVPVFVMVTGALLLHREYQIGSFLKKRLIRVVIPFIFWSLVYVGYSWYNEDITFTDDAWRNIVMVLRLLKTGSAYHLWYVYMLIGLYFFIPVIGKFVRNASEREILYFLAVWFVVILLSQPYLLRYNPSVDMHYFAGFAGYLVLGHYLAFKDFAVKRLQLWMVLLFAASVGLIALGSRLLAGGSAWPGTMFYEPVSPLVVLLSGSAFMAFKLSKSTLSPGIKRVRDFAGNFNYGIYLAHALILFLLDDLLGINYKLCTPVVSIPLTALICLLITLALVWVVNKIPLVGRWISG